MPSLAHMAIALSAVRVTVGSRSRRFFHASLVLGAASLIADIDIIALPWDPPRYAMWGHRGASHSLLIAAGIGWLTAVFARRLALPGRHWAFWGFLVATTHLILDCLNHGSEGVPWLWPISAMFYGVTWQPIPAVIHVSHFFSWAGVRVVIYEALLFGPVFLWALWPRLTNRGKSLDGMSKPSELAQKSPAPID